MQNYKKIAYFLSSWIANLGVVPLFLLAAFLSLPIFFFLFLRLFLSTFVFETILKFLLKIKSYEIRYLPLRRQTVKRIILAIAFFIGPRTLETKTLPNFLISKGEHREIKVSSLAKISVGNPQILSYKYQKKSKVLLIKGKKMGFTDLIIWTHGGIKLTYQIYVLSKTKQLSILHLAKTLKAIGLKTSMAGTLIVARGEIKDLNDYLLLLKWEKDYKTSLHLKVEISKSLKKKIRRIISSFISPFLYSRLPCHNNGLKIVCMISKGNGPDPSILRYLKKTYSINFLNYEKVKSKNYLLKFKIFQIEKRNGETIGFNFDQSSFFLGEIFKIGLKKFLKKNDVFFTNNKVIIKTVAEPEILVIEGKKSVIEIGAEIPYKINGEVPHTQWKFAGLRIKTNLKKVGLNYLLEYETLISRPKNSDSISGNREKSTVILKVGTPVQLFQIGLKTEGRNNEGVPFLGHIPIISSLFGTRSTQLTYKKITGLIVLEEQHDGKKSF